MRIATFLNAAGEPRAGLVLDRRIVDIAAASHALGLTGGALPSSVEALLALPDGLARTAQLQARVPAEAPFIHALASARLKAPVMRPEKIFGIGQNYADHCREMGRPIPTELRIFAMFANALSGPGEEIVLPKTSTQMDWEAELVVVIGRRGKHISPEHALDYVAGYTCGNDISARDHQAKDPMVMRGKSGDTHAPLGPWIVTKDEIPDPGALRIGLTVNGVTKQDSTTAELVFSVQQIIAFLSHYYTLAPGDLIYTGTPHGVGLGRNPPEWLSPGDRVEVTIERIGSLANTCVAEPT
jgi:2-keto-4-pentenoate hydratase/2-oxohepta-3-ene-1,7-dioic acid hydratase in catechol pathway